MGTEQSVLDGKKLSDAQLGKLHRKFGEVIKRINDETVNHQEALDVLQYIIIEGKSAEHLGVVWKTHKIVKIESEKLKLRRKLIPQGVTTVPAFSGNVEEFFSGKSGVSVIAKESFREVILARASQEVSCKEHRKEIHKLSIEMNDSEIQAELGKRVHQTIDQYLSSVMSRVSRWQYHFERGRVTHPAIDIEYVNIGDRVVVVACHMACFDWHWHCFEMLEYGRWHEGYETSSLPA